jgi:hypothetical protein
VELLSNGDFSDGNDHWLGDCGCFLLVQEKGVNYEMKDGFPILPIFQVAPYNTPDYPGGSTLAPKFSHKPCVWTALQ